jgi:hypothetical protein
MIILINNQVIKYVRLLSLHPFQLKLPLELWEQVVLKAFLMRHLAEWKTKSRPARTVYLTLAAVCASWRRIATQRVWFERTLRQQLAKKGS